MDGKIVVGNWEAELQKNGSYLYKAKEGPRPSFLAKPKPIYKEKPQYPLIEEYESVAKERYKKDLHRTVIDIVTFIKTL